MKKFVILIMVTMVFLLVFVAGGLAKPEKIEDVSLVVYNRCTAEYVLLTGTLYINELPSGELHVKCHFVGFSSRPGIKTEYIADGTLNLKDYSLSPYLEGTGIIIITCISKGEGPNFILKARGFEWDYSGSITIANFIDGEIVCVGE